MLLDMVDKIWVTDRFQVNAVKEVGNEGLFFEMLLDFRYYFHCEMFATESTVDVGAWLGVAQRP